MKYIRSARIILLLLILSYSIKVLSITENKLITELKVLDNDSSYRYVFFYDDLGNKMLETKYFLNGNIWIRKSQTEWKYDAGVCTNQTERVWDKTKWRVTYAIDYVFINGKLNTETHNRYVNNVAQLTRKIEYQYNSTQLKSKKQFDLNANIPTLSLQSDYSQSREADTVRTSVFDSGNIVKQYQLTTKYNAGKQIEKQLVEEKTANANWQNLSLTQWYYKPNSALILSQRTKTWNEKEQLWEFSQKVDYEYNTNNQLTSETYQYWSVLFWENDTRYNYVYDTGNKLIKKVLVKPIYHTWRELLAVTYSDFSDNKARLMESKYEFWGGNKGESTSSFIEFDFNNSATIERAKTLEISYLTPSDIIESMPQTLSAESIPVYPNPSNGIYYVNTQKYGIQWWMVTDMSGRLLRRENQSFGSGVIDITDLPQGIYLLKVRTQDALLTQKLIKN